MTVSDVTRIFVLASVDESDIGRVQVGILRGEIVRIAKEHL